MQTIRLISAFILFGSFPVLGFDIAAVGVLGRTSANIDVSGRTTSTDPKFGVGYGILASVYSIPGFTVESGILSLTRSYAASLLPTDIISLKMYEIPVLLRFDLLPIMAAGIGGYLAFGSGSVTQSNGVTDQTSTYEANNLGKTDYGLMASISLSLPILPTLKILGDVRYLIGLANLSTTSGTTHKFNDLQLLAGIRLSV